MDATFKIVSKPFYQLFSIHAFVRGEDKDMKQVPLLFALMSHRRTNDYKAVMNAVNELTQENQVQKAVADFERAMWKGVEAIFPHSCEWMPVPLSTVYLEKDTGSWTRRCVQRKRSYTEFRTQTVCPAMFATRAHRSSI